MPLSPPGGPGGAPRVRVRPISLSYDRQTGFCMTGRDQPAIINLQCTSNGIHTKNGDLAYALLVGPSVTPREMREAPVK